MVRLVMFSFLSIAIAGAGLAQDDPAQHANDALDRGDALGAHGLISTEVARASATDRAYWLRLQGYTEVLLRRYPAATATYREALRLDPGDAYSLVELGGLLASAGRFGEAERLYDSRSDAPGVADARRALIAARDSHAEVQAKVDAGRRALRWIGIAAAGFLALLAVIGHRVLR